MPRDDDDLRDDDEGYSERPSKRKARRRDDEDDDYQDAVREAASRKMTVGLIGIFLGAYGVHKFMLGYTNAGVIQLLVTIFTCGMGGFIGFIEGIIYLTKSDEDFYETYILNKKEWF